MTDMPSHNRAKRAFFGIHYRVAAPLLFLMLLGSAGCTKVSSAAKFADPLVVEVAEVIQKDVLIYSDWIGTLDGLVNANIKAQVTGYLTKQAYTEGTFVRAGDLLFQIDPRPFQALDLAQAQLAQAQGHWHRHKPS